jgi:hypothetical protein
MLPVSAAELAAIQTDASAAACDQVCVISRGTRSIDSQGGASVTWGTVVTTVAGMRQPTAGQLQNYQYIVGSLATWQVVLPVGTNVLEKDRLLIGGQTLNVVKLLEPNSYSALIVALATEVK